MFARAWFTWSIAGPQISLTNGMLPRTDIAWNAERELIPNDCGQCESLSYVWIVRKLGKEGFYFQQSTVRKTTAHRVSYA